MHFDKELGNKNNMNILVCIKQVPDTPHVDIDPKTGNLKREGADNKINLYDLYALETALAIRKECGGYVTAVSMGPPQAERAIREALTLGADDGVLLSDRAFAGADVLATAYTVSQAIRSLGGFDLIICGKQTTDGDTAQVGPALAELLDIPHAALVTEILNADNKQLSVRQDMGETFLDVCMPFPCLITIEKSKNTPRLPSYLCKKKFSDVKIRILSINDFEDNDTGKYGVNGSATQVERIFPPAVNTDKVTLTGTSDTLASGIFDALTQKQMIGENI